MSSTEFESGISRRNVLQAAGGFTFLSLLPAASFGEVDSISTDASSSPKGPLPVFTALPYLQPGAASALKDGEESIVVAWQTNGVPASFRLTYGPSGTEKTAEISETRLKSGTGGDTEQRINRVATLEGLRLGRKYRYRVFMNDAPFIDGHFTTRKARGQQIRFVVFGDNSFGDVSDRAIAYQSYKASPDFVMNTGDNVYESGKDDEYARYFFPVYNAEQAGPRTGAPLLRSVPFYTVIANHDVAGKDANHHPVADFTKNKDALGYFTNMHLPGNGPIATYPTPLAGPAEAINTFKANAGDRYPRQSNYSFDYGDAHFLCLDSNVYVDPTDPALQDWIEKDLTATDAAWKIVVYHHPAFNVGNEHYKEQQMRVLSPVFERLGVDIAFHGHEHTYQRTRPLKFEVVDASGAKDVGSGSRLVSGKFTVDRGFDGKGSTRPEGIVYVTSGAGGKHLYDPEMNGVPGSWLHEEDSQADYVAAMVTDRHSLTVIDLDHKTLSLLQVDEWGNEIDRIRITKN
jgi:hypothetical protein